MVWKKLLKNNIKKYLKKKLFLSYKLKNYFLYINMYFRVKPERWPSSVKRITMLFVKYGKLNKEESLNWKNYILTKKIFYLQRKNRGSKIKSIFFQKKTKKRKVYYFNKKKNF